MSGQTAYIAQWFHYFAGLADKIEGSVIPLDKPDYFNFTRCEPLGVVAAIVPWNSPLLLAAWKLAPALAAGNTVVMKPSEYTSASMLEFMKLVDAGRVSARRRERGDRLRARMSACRSSNIRYVAKVAFTGSDATGQRIYETAAKGLKRVTMELGGKSPNIVFDDADLESALMGVVSGIFAATGQTCVAGSRLLVQRSDSRRLRREAGGVREERADGEPDERRHAGGSDHHPAAVREDPDIHRRGEGGGRPRLGGRNAASRRSAARAGSSSRPSSTA